MSALQCDLTCSYLGLNRSGNIQTPDVRFLNCPTVKAVPNMFSEAMATKTINVDARMHRYQVKRISLPYHLFDSVCRTCPWFALLFATGPMAAILDALSCIQGIHGCRKQPFMHQITSDLVAVHAQFCKCQQGYRKVSLPDDYIECVPSAHRLHIAIVLPLALGLACVTGTAAALYLLRYRLARLAHLHVSTGRAPPGRPHPMAISERCAMMLAFPCQTVTVLAAPSP